MSDTNKERESVVIDFSQVGTAGPFPVVNGRVQVPDVTMLDLARMLKPTSDALAAPMPQSAGVTDEQLHILDRLYCAGWNREGNHKEEALRAVLALATGLAPYQPQPEPTSKGEPVSEEIAAMLGERVAFLRDPAVYRGKYWDSMTNEQRKQAFTKLDGGAAGYAKKFWTWRHFDMGAEDIGMASQQREPQEAAGYLDGVNVDRLRKALTKMGCSSGAGEEDAASRLAELVNRLTLSVERFALSAPQEAEKRRDERETFEAHMHGYSLARDGDGYIDWNTRSAWWVWQASASIDRAPLATPPSAMRAALVETEAVLSADGVYPELHKMVRAALSAPQEAGKAECGICHGDPEACDPHDCGDMHAKEAGKVEAVADERQPSDGDYLRWAEQAGAKVNWDFESASSARVVFLTASQWGRFCDKVRALYLRPSQQALSVEEKATIERANKMAHAKWTDYGISVNSLQLVLREVLAILAAAGGSEK